MESYVVASAEPIAGEVVVPVDPVPHGWPKDWRKAVDEFRASTPEAFAWSCDWHSSDRAFRKSCARVLAVLELRHGPQRHVEWVLIAVNNELWSAFLAEFRELPVERQERIVANVALHDQNVANRLADRRVQRALEAAGGRVVWNTLEPFDRRRTFVELADRMRLEPDMIQAQFEGGLVVDVSFRRPGGCRVSVEDEGDQGSRSKSETVHERQVADGTELDAAIREAVRIVGRR